MPWHMQWHGEGWTGDGEPLQDCVAGGEKGGTSMGEAAALGAGVAPPSPMANSPTAKRPKACIVPGEMPAVESGEESVYNGVNCPSSNARTTSPPGRRVSKVATADRVKLSPIAPGGKDARAPHASTTAKATSAMTASASATRRAGWACRDWVCSLDDVRSGVSEGENPDEEEKRAGDLEVWPVFARANPPEAPPAWSTRVRDT